LFWIFHGCRGMVSTGKCLLTRVQWRGTSARWGSYVIGWQQFVYLIRQSIFSFTNFYLFFIFPNIPETNLKSHDLQHFLEFPMIIHPHPINDNLASNGWNYLCMDKEENKIQPMNNQDLDEETKWNDQILPSAKQNCNQNDSKISSVAPNYNKIDEDEKNENLPITLPLSFISEDPPDPSTPPLLLHETLFLTAKSKINNPPTTLNKTLTRIDHKAWLLGTLQEYWELEQLQVFQKATEDEMEYIYKNQYKVFTNHCIFKNRINAHRLISQRSTIHSPRKEYEEENPLWKLLFSMHQTWNHLTDVHYCSTMEMEDTTCWHFQCLPIWKTWSPGLHSYAPLLEWTHWRWTLT